MSDTSRLAAALADRYRIERELGQGGMATVYLAHDVRHDRKVALKVLRPELAAILGGERFLAEIKTTANLQHPHILSLFDSGDADGLVYYVMPYVEGESLRDRLTREKQLPVDDAVRIALEVADALQYAHEHGIVHRDIKPENILLHGGHAMVADFGIALAASRSDGGTRMTETGMSLGTPHYMAPEQAMGEKEITPKADIYALGCVLYEMLTAEPPFVGATAQAIIARVMTEEPRSLTLQRRTVPQHIEAAVVTALAKLPADRFATAAQFAEALSKPEFALAATRARPAAAAPASWKRRALAVGPWLLFLTAAGVGARGWLRPKPAELVRRERIQLGSPETPPGAIAFGVAIAPDGATIVFVDSLPGATGFQLYAKERGRLEATPLTGTSGARGPTFSPDGRWIAFVADGKLKKVPRLGGSAVAVVDSANRALPAIAWLDNDSIAFNDAAYNLKLVSASGGEARTVHSVLATSRGIVSVTGLPGGRAVLASACTLGCPELDLRVINLATDSAKVLVGDVYKAWHTALGTVVFVRRDGGVFSAPFAMDSLGFASAPAPVFDGVRTVLGGVDMQLGADGTVLYAQGSANTNGRLFQLVWVSRTGAATLLDSSWTFQPSANFGFALSPDGRRLALSISSGASQDVWIKDLPAGPLTRLTFGGTNQRPRWTADGRSVTYVARTTGQLVAQIRLRHADGTGSESTLVALKRSAFDYVVGPDTSRRTVRLGGAPSRDIYLMVHGADSAAPLIATDQFEEVGPAISPDGRWLAYTSNESGRNEVYVRPFPDVNAGRWQVSRSGGREPQWSHTGHELFYRDGALNFVSVPIRPGASFAMGEPRVLFASKDYDDDFAYHKYAVAPGDNRFLFARNTAAAPGAAPVTLVLIENWFAELRQGEAGPRE